MCFGLSDPCTVCYSVDTTTEHSPLKSSEKEIWWHFIGFFKPHFILDLWMMILLHLWNRRAFSLLRMVWIMYHSIPKPPIPSPPGQTPGHLTFLKNLGQIPCHVASLDGQMPHPLELQRGSNPPPSRHVKATVLNFFSCVKPFISSSTSVPSSVTISTSTSEFKPSFSFPDANQIQWI